MTKKETAITSIALAAMTALLAWHLHTTQEYIYYYREQQQIFLQDSDFMAALLRSIGGLTTLAAQALVQYFNTPGAGAVITALISGLSATLLWFTIKRLKAPWPIMPLAFAPVLLQNIGLVQTSCHYDALVALLLMTATLWVYTLISDRSQWGLRLAIGAILTALLFFYAGPVATLFALNALIYDLLKRHSKAILGLFYVALCGILSFISVGNGLVVGYDYALWAKGYHEYFANMGWLQHLTWLSTSLLLLLAWAVTVVQLHLRAALKVILCAMLALGLAAAYAHKTDKTKEKDLYTLMQLFNDINHEDWDALLANPNINARNLLHMNCVNLALSKKGMLLDQLFKYPQVGAQSLIAGYQAYNDVNVLFSHIYYQMGVVSEALCLSFGTMIATTDGNPSLLKLLIKERLIYGDYDVAEKYISRLEKTRSYATWARQQRKYLYNDQAVEADAELGLKRRDLPKDGTKFVSVNGIFNDLKTVVETNPADKNAQDYNIALLLLQKDMNMIKAFVDTYYGTDVLPALPDALQQAVISYAEKDPTYCLNHGVSEEMLRKFAAFRQTTMELRHSRQNVQAGLASYRGTFWYYLMF